MQKLREKDANLIVAGQAIADPSCIVKELVDNSIDAGASKIDITLTNFGIDGISVSDDGNGIQIKDASLLGISLHSSDLLEVNQKKQLEKGEFSINGYIDLNPSQSSKNFFYLNEKLFSSPKLVKKITQAIQNITQRQNQMLFYVLFIVTSEKIDHNVSMNKMSKFINNESELFSFVTESIIESICNTKSSQVLSSKPLFTQSSFTPDQLTSSQKDADSNLTFINPNRDSIDMSMAPSTPQSKSTKSMSSYTFSPTLPSLPSNYMQHFKLSQDTNQKSKDYNNTIKVEISKCKNMSNTIETDLEALKKGSLSISALMEKFEEKDDKTTTKISMKTFENDLKNLSQRIEQSLLSKMQIVGQFNRGFIIARNGLHFYIIDQHGADERFNFDHFLSQEKYDNQKLVVYF
ncbi:MAG: ATP-binding mismatch repair protein [Paramarteilia canceri]